MEPSHLPVYSKPQIERIAFEKLQEAFPKLLSIPVDIDLVAEKQSVFDSIRFIPKLQEKYNVVATLQSKPIRRCDIVLDENMTSTNNPRTNFSVAHELAHIVLHEELYLDCYTIEESVALSKRIENESRDSRTRLILLNWLLSWSGKLTKHRPGLLTNIKSTVSGHYQNTSRTSEGLWEILPNTQGKLKTLSKEYLPPASFTSGPTFPQAGF